MADVPAGGLADVLAEKLTVVFVGINPAPLSVAAGHSFATPGNRFWPALYASGCAVRQECPTDPRQRTFGSESDVGVCRPAQGEGGPAMGGLLGAGRPG
ncbi:uracil-DNA glycosylase family protein [Sphaerisporangium sp. NPDC005289]|uniref:uracil-DNA glycosylase family protein n=1 Tax=Sphaerisporangium sp. NPDC005289 TaxID=3155247 RepID=UPI00339EEE1D